jgi:tetratricopeptide (TPR) repeat protein
MVPPRQTHLEKLKKELEQLERARQSMRRALSQYNDIAAQEHFAPLIDLLGVILENERQGIAHFLASDLENIASALRRFELPDEDPVLEAEIPSLQAMIAARGRIADRLAGCLQELKNLRFPAPDIAASYVPVPRDLVAEALIRLDERLRATEDSIAVLRAEAREADAAGTNVAQSGLINFHVSSLKVEVSAARFEASIAQLVDMAALARAAKAVRELGADLAAFASAAYSRIVATVAAAGRLTARLAGRAARGVVTVVSLARRRLSGRVKPAQPDADRALEAQASQAAPAFNSEEMRREFWRLIDNGDEAVRLGGLDNAAGAYEMAQSVAHRALEAQPDDQHWQRDLSVSHEKIGNIRRAQGDLAGALESFEASLVIRQSLTARDPANSEWQRDLSVSHSKIGDVRREQGDLAGALKGFEASLAIAQTLAARDPANTEWQRDLSVSHEKIGNVRRAQGDLAGALKSFEASLAIAQTLAARNPANTQWQRDLAVSHNKIGDIRATQGDLAGALGSYEAGLAIAQTLAARDPANTLWQGDLAATYGKIGQCLRSQGRTNEAKAAFERGLAIVEPLVKQSPDVVLWQQYRQAFLADIASVTGTAP